MISLNKCRQSCRATRPSILLDNFYTTGWHETQAPVFNDSWGSETAVDGGGLCLISHFPFLVFPNTDAGQPNPDEIWQQEKIIIIIIKVSSFKSHWRHCEFGLWVGGRQVLEGQKKKEPGKVRLLFGKDSFKNIYWCHCGFVSMCQVSLVRPRHACGTAEFWVWRDPGNPQKAWWWHQREGVGVEAAPLGLQFVHQLCKCSSQLDVVLGDQTQGKLRLKWSRCLFASTGHAKNNTSPIS